MRIITARNGLLLATLLAALAGCTRRGDIDPTGGIVQVRSACPAAAIPAQTGDVTLFSPANSTDASAIDVVATITNLRSTCSEGGDQFATEATFDVVATRRDASAARQVTLPYFVVATRGGTSVVSKRVGQVTLSFAAGEARASTQARASSYVDKSAATLPPEIQTLITKPRKSGDADAATDPLARPEVRAAIQRTSFELLVGFNLTREQLRYNATR
ncbi:hypothetical protein [Sphingobium sp. CR28]|uniref:hypothetical protein n=1 Tax=Sphingobium sp. CR28 TaxID=3400272 RepID=UPI003FEDB539